MNISHVLLRGSLMLLFLPLLFLHTAAQVTYTIDTANSQIWVEGTSTLRDWKAEVGNWQGEVVVDDAGNIQNVQVTLEVTSLDGGRGSDMNDKIYKALKASEHPHMEFTGMGATPPGNSDVAVEGEFAMAGLTKPLTVSATGSLDGNLTGSIPIKFSDYEIDPPTAMFGTIVAHDDATIVFDISLTKK